MIASHNNRDITMKALKTKVTDIFFMSVMFVMFHAITLWDKDFGAHE